MKLTNTNKSDDEPYNSGCKMIIPKEDYSSVNNINQQTNTQHYSKNDPWQEQVMISLRINRMKNVSFNKLTSYPNSLLKLQ